MRNRKRFLAGLLALCMVLALLPVSALAADDTASADGSYNDVAENYWGKEAIDRWSSLEIMQGTGSGNFEPEREMYRCEFATVLVRLMGYTDVGDVSFPDLPEDAWYTDAMLKLAAAGVMQGDGYNAMPMGVITREQVAVLLCRALGLKPTGEGELTFSDSDKVDSWAKDAMTALAERGMINGVGENTLAPLANITRASVAQLTSNMIAYYVTEDTVITDETVKGIVLVAGDAKVTLENTTTENPVVVAPKADSAEVVLAGTTKAEDINVAANNATVTVAETASASNVSVSGTEATIDVEGKVETVTVNEGGSNASVTVGEKAEVTTVAANGTAAKVDVAGKVETVAVGEQASNAAVNVAKGAEVTTVETDAAGTTVAVAGTVGTVAVGETAEKSNVSVAKGAAVTDVNTAAPETSVDVAGKVTNVTVADTAADTALTVERNATVAKVETAADNVSVDGSGKVTNMTVTAGEGVTVSKDTTVTKVENQSDSTVAVGNKNVASGNTSSNRPSTGGSSGGTTNPGTDPGTTTEKYTVSIGTFTGGTITADVTEATEANKEVTLTVTPNAQSGETLPYILKENSLKVTFTPAAGGDDADVTVTANKFTMATAGTYTVTAEFVQPISSAAMFIAKDEATLQQMIEYGYPEGDTSAEALGVKPWLFIGIKRNLGDAETAAQRTALENISLTADDATVEQPWDDLAHYKYATAYVESEQYEHDPHENPDKLNLDGVAYTFKLSFTYMGASYSFTCGYTKSGVEEDDLVTVKFGDTIRKNTAGQTVTAPAAPGNTDQIYYTGTWTSTAPAATVEAGGTYTIPADTAGKTEIVFTADSLPITPADLTTQPDAADVKYSEIYETAGMSFANGTISVEKGKLYDYVQDEDQDTSAILDERTGKISYGLQFTLPQDATKAVYSSTLDFTTPTEATVTEGKFVVSFDVAEIDENGAWDFTGFESATCYVKYLNADNKVVAVTKNVINVSYTGTIDAKVTLKVKNFGDITKEVSYDTAIAGILDELTTSVTAAMTTAKMNDLYDFKGFEYNNEAVTAETKFTVAEAELTPILQAKANITLPADDQDLGLTDGGKASSRQDLGTELTFTANADDPTKLEATIAESGTLTWGVWNGFSSILDEKSGYYATVLLTLPEGVTETQVANAKITYGCNETETVSADTIKAVVVDSDRTLQFSIIVGKSSTAGAIFTDKKITITVDWDGDAGEAVGTTYTIDLSKVTAVKTAPGDDDVTGLTPTINTNENGAVVEGLDIREESGKYYVCYNLSKGEDAGNLELKEDSIIAAASVKDGTLVPRYLYVDNAGNPGSKPTPNLSLPENSFLEGDGKADKDHHVGLTLRITSDAEGEATDETKWTAGATWYFWAVEEDNSVKVYKAVIEYVSTGKTPGALDADDSGVDENAPGNGGSQDSGASQGGAADSNEVTP